MPSYLRSLPNVQAERPAERSAPAVVREHVSHGLLGGCYGLRVVTSTIGHGMPFLPSRRYGMVFSTRASRMRRWTSWLWRSYRMRVRTAPFVETSKTVSSERPHNGEAAHVDILKPRLPQHLLICCGITQCE